MATAATAVAGATGIRAWLAARGYAWATAARLRFISAVLLTVAVLAAASGLA